MSHVPSQRINKSNWMFSNPLELEVAKGNVNGMSGFYGFGERDAVASIATGVDIWRGTANSIPIPNQSGGERMIVTSSHYDDRLTGTGIQKVEIDYLDATGNEQYETINMNGTVWARTAGTNIRFINAIHSTQNGSGEVSSGDVSVFAEGTLTKVYNMISTGGNMSLSTLKMIPKNKSFYLNGWRASVVTPTASSIARLRLRATMMHGTRMNTSVFLFNDTAHCSNSFFENSFDVPVKIPALSLIKVTAWTNAADLYVSASYSGILIDDD